MDCPEGIAVGQDGLVYVASYLKVRCWCQGSMLTRAVSNTSCGTTPLPTSSWESSCDYRAAILKRLFSTTGFVTRPCSPDSLWVQTVAAGVLLFRNNRVASACVQHGSRTRHAWRRGCADEQHCTGWAHWSERYSSTLLPPSGVTPTSRPGA